MSPSRREVLEAALAAALAAATPKSLFAAAERVVPPSERFLIVSLRDGRLLAVDRLSERKAYLMNPGPARDGEYALSKSGSLLVQNGALRDVHGTAESMQFTFVKSANAIEIRNSQGRTVSRLTVSGERHR